MSLTSLSVRRGVTAFMIYLMAAGFGLFSLIRLKLDLYPNLEFPYIAVMTSYVGVAPADMETVVTRPIEESVGTVENVKQVTSMSMQGISAVMLEFEWGTDINQAQIDVRNALEYIKDVMPADATNPMIFAFDLSDMPIIQLTLDSKVHGMAELRRISEHELEPRLERIPGVASSFTVGGLSREIQVQADPLRMRAHNVSILQVLGALQMNNQQIASGWVQDPHQEYTIQTAGEYQSLAEIENTPVMASGSAVVRVKDVAKVVDGFAEQRQRVYTNNSPAVVVMIQKQSDANTVAVSREVAKQMPAILSELPKGLKIETLFSQADFINKSMANLGSSAWQAIVLTFLVLLFFLRNLRSSLIVAVSIPVSMLVTFAVMDYLGLSLNIISMAGLALAVGMIVDNSIVVLEVVFRHHEEGESPRDAAERGTHEVAMAITASTLTTLVVFVPVLFVPGIAGELFNDMVVTIVVSLAISLLVAITLIPLLASRFFSSARGNGRSRFERLNSLSDRIGGWLNSLHDAYAKALHWALNHRRRVLVIVGVAFVLSVVFLVKRGGEFMPRSDQGYIQMTVDRSPGISLESMAGTMSHIYQTIQETVPEAEIIYHDFGQQEGAFAIFSSSGSNQGSVMIKLKPLGKRKRSAEAIQNDLRDRLKNLPDVDLQFSDRGEQMMGSGGDIVIEIYGQDLKVSEALAETVVDTIKAIKGVADTEISVKKAKPELVVRLDRQRISDLGLSTSSVGQAISTSVLGTVATRYREGGDEYNIRVRLDEDSRQSQRDVENLLIMTPAGRQVPLRSVADVVVDRAPMRIDRKAQERLVTVSVDVSGRSLNTTSADVKKALKKVAMPTDYRIAISGQAAEMAKSFMYLALAFLVAMVLCYMVMASQFESYLDPFVIMFTIPLAIIGVALALIVTWTPMNIMVLIGVVMLVGIVVNNGIVLVDYTNQLHDGGMPLFDAIEKAGLTRMRPVLMTAMTTILGMLPLALGIGESGETWAPMARAVMGGLTVATVLTLLVVPIIYAIMEIRRDKYRAKKEAKRKAELKKKR
ncbi:MAG: efflux RND transporter permease subunit [bacterium]|nr:efflux RND transporter permease subunit [bacterium]